MIDAATDHVRVGAQRIVGREPVDDVHEPRVAQRLGNGTLGIVEVATHDERPDVGTEQVIVVIGVARAHDLMVDERVEDPVDFRELSASIHSGVVQVHVRDRDERIALDDLREEHRTWLVDVVERQSCAERLQELHVVSGEDRNAVAIACAALDRGMERDARRIGTIPQHVELVRNAAGARTRFVVSNFLEQRHVDVLVAEEGRHVVQRLDTFVGGLEVHSFRNAHMQVHTRHAQLRHEPWLPASAWNNRRTGVHDCSMSTISMPVERSVLESVFRDAVGALEDADVSFAVTGSFGWWAHGGSFPGLDEDVDIALREVDVAAAATALHERGFRIQSCPEGWLVKAYHPRTNGCSEHLFVDLIHSMVGLPITDDVLERAVTTYVTAVAVRVLAPIDMMSTRLCILSPTHLDFTDIIQHARMFREQFDWDELERRASGNPSALAFFDVARRLGVDPRCPSDHAAPARNSPAEQVMRLSVATREALAALGVRETVDAS